MIVGAIWVVSTHQSDTCGLTPGAYTTIGTSRLAELVVHPVSSFSQ
jgi:hypothetical protein